MDSWYNYIIFQMIYLHDGIGKCKFSWGFSNMIYGFYKIEFDSFRTHSQGKSV